MCSCRTMEITSTPRRQQGTVISRSKVLSSWLCPFSDEFRSNLCRGRFLENLPMNFETFFSGDGMVAGSCLANKYGIRADLLQVASAARRNSAAEEVSITQGLFSTRTFSPPPSVLRQIGTQQQPWKSGACGDSSSLSSIDNVSKVLHHNCYHFLRIWCQESQSGGLVFPLFLMHRHDAPGFAFDPRTTKEFFV